MGRIYNYLLQQDTTRYTIVSSLDGYDEISLTGDTRLISREGERIVPAEALGKRIVSPPDISGGNSVEDAAKIFLQILKGEGSWAQNAVVLANAATALHTTGKFGSYEDAFQAAVESLESGRAHAVLKAVLN